MKAMSFRKVLMWIQEKAGSAISIRTTGIRHSIHIADALWPQESEGEYGKDAFD